MELGQCRLGVVPIFLTKNIKKGLDSFEAIRYTVKQTKCKVNGWKR